MHVPQHECNVLPVKSYSRKNFGSFAVSSCGMPCNNRFTKLSQIVNRTYRLVPINWRYSLVSRFLSTKFGPRTTDLVIGVRAHFFEGSCAEFARMTWCHRFRDVIIKLYNLRRLQMKGFSLKIRWFHHWLTFYFFTIVNQSRMHLFIVTVDFLIAFHF
jgi:hypothetical protein